MVKKWLSYGLNVSFPRCLMDERIEQLYASCKGNYKRMEELSAPFRESAWDPLAERLVSFLFNYKNGLLAPEKWGYYEPLKNRVDDSTERTLVHQISIPGFSTLLLRRNHKPQVWTFIDNGFPNKNPLNSFLWQGPYFGGICIWFDRRCSFRLDEWIPVLKDLCQLMETDYGYIYEMEKTINTCTTKRILAHTFSTPYHELVGRSEDDILGARRMFDFIRNYLHSDYPIVCTKACTYYESGSYLESGKLAYGLMIDTIKKLTNEPVQTGLALEFNMFFKAFNSFDWEDPTCFQDSYLYIAKQHLIESLANKYNIYPLPIHNYPTFSEFQKGYFIEERDTKFRKVLLLP